MKALQIIRPAEVAFLDIIQLVVEMASCGDCVGLSECHDAQVNGVDVADDDASH